MEVPVLSEDRERSSICVLYVSILPLYEFYIGFWNYTDSVVFFVLHFVICKQRMVDNTTDHLKRAKFAFGDTEK